VTRIPLTRKLPTEAQEQEVVIKWSQYAGISAYLIHIPNGGSRNYLEACKLKRQGVKAGVSDLFFAYPKNNYHGLWLEIKRRKPLSSVLSKHQKEWIELMKNVGYKCDVAFGATEAISIISDYIGKSTNFTENYRG